MRWNFTIEAILCIVLMPLGMIFWAAHLINPDGCPISHNGPDGKPRRVGFMEFILN